MLDRSSPSRLILRCSNLRLLLLPDTGTGTGTASYSTTTSLSIPIPIPNPSLFACNSAIRAHPHLNPVPLYSRMLAAASTRPDRFTFTFLLKSCSHRRDASNGQSLHSHTIKLSFHADLFINNALIFLYSTCGLIESAYKVFEDMPHRDIVSENSILIAYLRCGDLDAALGMFTEMRVRNVRTWNSIISGFIRGGRCKEALDMFREMLVSADGAVRPDKITVASVISACSSLGALEQGRWLHGYLKRQRLEFDVVIGTALVDMYGKCGCVERAVEVFEEMPRRDVLAWTAVISALAVHGLGEEAFARLEEMERHGVKPNNVTFGALLSACAHSGMVGRGRWCFDVMRRVYAIEPQLQHYACMVYLLGRAGHFGEAERLIGSMPMEPDLFVWGALLGACRMHGNVELGERVAGYLIRLDPHNHAYYIVLSDIYADAKRFEDVKRVRAFMKEHEIKKTSPGCSMIEVGGEVHEFSIKGTPKNTMKEIEWVLIGINDELRCTGYFPNALMDTWRPVDVSEVDVC
ncbi:pentatricopeptide repeat-containing protein-like [Iris pallida]|uniref:Pentatricopeptide repeat-containing protein-like n=1 Tax=Iris pallida TaxID=29817 RepID=A0AAX6GCD8_IRIPA|nr:pentatricopeptide repeat-containing protein-like [Iris pallida]